MISRKLVENVSSLARAACWYNIESCFRQLCGGRGDLVEKNFISGTCYVWCFDRASWMAVNIGDCRISYQFVDGASTVPSAPRSRYFRRKFSSLARAACGVCYYPIQDEGHGTSFHMYVIYIYTYIAASLSTMYAILVVSLVPAASWHC